MALARWEDVEIKRQENFLVALDWCSQQMHAIGDTNKGHFYQQMAYMVFRRLTYVEQLKANGARE